jgi:signal transduction histidine kinase
MTDVENDRRMIKLCAAREDRFDEPVVLVEVQDFGRGFNASDAERLFDAFYSTKPNGMGISDQPFDSRSPWRPPLGGS